MATKFTGTMYILYLRVICFIDTETVGNIKNICRASSENSSKTPSLLDAMFFTSSSTQVLYNLEVRVSKINAVRLNVVIKAKS